MDSSYPPTIGLCSDCKWWRDYDTPMTYSKFLMHGWKACMLTHTLGNAPEANPNTWAIACDWEDYQAVLFTAPNFGCIQWEYANG